MNHSRILQTRAPAPVKDQLDRSSLEADEPLLLPSRQVDAMLACAAGVARLARVDRRQPGAGAKFQDGGARNLRSYVVARTS